MNKVGHILSALVLAAFSSCTAVQVETNALDTVEVVCQTDWSKMQDLEQPDTFNVAFSRSVNAIHRYWEKVAMSTAEKPDTLNLPVGNYQALIFRSEPEDAYTFEKTVEFSKDSLVSMRELSARLVTVPHSVSKAACGHYEGLMVNYMDTVPQASQLYVAHQRQDFRQNASLTQLIFQPQPLVQTITFRIPIETPEGLSIQEDDVWGCITGVAEKVELMSTYVDIRELGQTWFPMHKISQEANVSTWEATVELLGIMAPEDAEQRTGPGMFSIGVTVGSQNQKVIKVVSLRPYLNREPSLVSTDTEYLFTRSNKLTHEYNIQTQKLDAHSQGSQGGEEPLAPWQEDDEKDAKEIIDGNDDPDD